MGALLDSGSSVSLIVADLVRRTRTEVEINHKQQGTLNQFNHFIFANGSTQINYNT